MFRDAIEDIRTGRFDIDFLMLVAAVGAATLGKLAEGALLLFLFSLGHALEHFAMGRAKRAIEALAELALQTALVRRDGSTEEVPVEQLQVADVVIVKPNERLPADGFVVKGGGSVNQAPITGESVPVDRGPSMIRTRRLRNQISSIRNIARTRAPSMAAAHWRFRLRNLLVNPHSPA